MKVENTYQKKRDDWYTWTISIQGSAQELSQIKKVTYMLHETFPNRQIVSTNPANNFARTVSGWGEFLVRVEITMKHAEKKTSEYWLDLGFENTQEYKLDYPGEIT